MIVYLAITALVNIALGYVLAVYIIPPRGTAEASAAPAETELRDDHVIEPVVEPMSVAPAVEPAAPVPAKIVAAAPAEPVISALAAEVVNEVAASAVPSPAAQTQAPAMEAVGKVEAAPVAEVAKVPAADATTPAPLVAETADVKVETDVLAGINEFRSQLAQMKGIATDEAAPVTEQELDALAVK